MNQKWAIPQKSLIYAGIGPLSSDLSASFPQPPVQIFLIESGLENTHLLIIARFQQIISWFPFVKCLQAHVPASA
jgi:hypothetical protein